MARYWYAFISRTIALAVIAVGLDAGASAQTETILHTFTGGTDGGNPLGGLVADAQGNLYGTAQSAGSGSGVVFELIPNQNGTWSEQVLYTFAELPHDGISPSGELTFDVHGNLYGTTQSGGTYNFGTVFELSPGAGGVWSEKVLHSFNPTNGDGIIPLAAGLALDRGGNLYGTTVNGGSSSCDCGAVFELSPAANGTWTEKVLYRFKGGNDGGGPFASGPVLDTAGNLYGVTKWGGAHDYGVVYELVRGTTGSWTQKVLYSFPGGNGGASPLGKLVFDSAGNLYGTTYYTAYELSPTSSGPWTIKTLHSFAGGADGANVQAGLVFDKAGNLYGTTVYGGKHRGTVFELIPQTNGTWGEKVLHRFAPTASDGINPQLADLIVDGNGNVYGTTVLSVGPNRGVAFKIAP